MSGNRDVKVVFPSPPVGLPSVPAPPPPTTPLVRVRLESEGARLAELATRVGVIDGHLTRLIAVVEMQARVIANLSERLAQVERRAANQ